MLIEQRPEGPSCPDITIAALSRDPYPIYSELRERAPVVWAPQLNMWLITKYQDVKDVLADAALFVNGAQDSLILRTFGENMLCTDGFTHRRFRPPQLSGAFMPRAVKQRFETSVDACVDDLLHSFAHKNSGDLRALYASRLPILVMLDVFGLPRSDEARFRAWYNDFEAALSNHNHDPIVNERAAASVNAFHDYFQQKIDLARSAPATSLLSDFVAQQGGETLNDEELRRNALIIFFGGISTVEALILNTLWALFQHPAAMDKILSDEEALHEAIAETMRWLSPVQSATRHTARDSELCGARIPAGAIVNCMLGSANRDPEVFEDPDLFIPSRANASKHLGFATGPHLCLGRHLALLEARAAISALVRKCKGLRPNGTVAPEGHEFRQPHALPALWDCT